MVKLYKVEFVYAYEPKHEYDAPSNKFAHQAFEDYFINEPDNEVKCLGDLPSGWTKDTLPYGTDETDTIGEILSDDVITVNGIRYQKVVE